MNPFFIHTFELTYRTDFNDLRELTDGLEMINFDGIYKSLRYVEYGITIESRRCEKEKKDGKGNYKLVLIIYPSRLIERGTYTNRIYGVDEIIKALESLKIIIESVFTNMTLNDFKLSRIDLTKDMCNIPERIIQEYILIMKRMALSYGFDLNKELEKNTEDFRPQDSFNVVNKSQGAEFVIYNKHRAAIDNKYPDEIIEHYTDTMRMELRCKRRYINFRTKNLSTEEAILFMYVYREDLMKNFYREIFKNRTDLCFVSDSWQRNFVKQKYGDKTNGIKLLGLLNEMKAIEHDLDTALNECYKSKNAIKHNLLAFNKMGFSPIPINRDDVSYMSSLDRVLGFGESNSIDKCCMRIKHSKGRKKVIFEYEQK